MGLHGAYSRVSDFREIARKPFSENEQCPRGFVEVVVVEEWERVHTVWVGCRPCSQGVERGRYFIKGDPLEDRKVLLGRYMDAIGKLD